MSKRPRSALEFSRRVLAIKVFTVAGLVLLWELAARSGLFFEGVVPSIVPIVRAVIQELVDKDFYHDLAITLTESGVGFVCGSLIAIVIAIGLGLNPYMRRMIEPFITAIGGTPKIIFLPILFLIFGLGIESKMAKAALSTFFPVVLSTMNGFVQISPVLLRVGKSFDLGRWQTISKIYIPAMMNPLLTGLRLGMSVAIIGVLSAEITYSNGGLGFRLIRNADQFKITSVYAVAILIFAVAATINAGITKLQQRVNRHERGRVTEGITVIDPAILQRA
jgi:NitT/TauT family transport system permease protein